MREKGRDLVRRQKLLFESDMTRSHEYDIGTLLQSVAKCI